MYHTKLMTIFGAIWGPTVACLYDALVPCVHIYGPSIASQQSIIICMLRSLQSKVVRNAFPRKSPQNGSWVDIGSHPRRPRWAVIIQSTIFSPLYNKCF